MKAIDSLEEIEAKSYAPLYDEQLLLSSSLQLPSFAAKIMENEQKILNDINNMSKSEKNMIKKQQESMFSSPFISSVKIIIKEGRVDINEDYDKNIDEIEIIDPTISSIPAQTFRLDFKSLQVTHIVKNEQKIYQNKQKNEKDLCSKVAYLILKTNDICLLEFDEVLKPFEDNVDHKYLSIHNDNNNNDINSNQIVKGKANPLLFKTLETQTFGKNKLFDKTNKNKEDESDVLHLFLSLRVKQVENNDDDDEDDEDDDDDDDDDDDNNNNKNNNNDTFLQIFTLVNLRALTHELRLESEWHTKLGEFFSVDTMNDDNDNDNDDGISNNINNITNVYINAYDCCVSYNPIPISERLVVACEKIKISTNVVALSPMVSVSIECYDGAVYLHPKSLKSFSQNLSNLFMTKYQLNKPFLHRLPGNLLADHLDSIGFVRILDFDWIESFISQNKKIKKDEISINGGTVKIKTCQDSTKSLLNIIKYFIDQVIKQPIIQEVEVLLPDDSDDTENFDKIHLNEHHDSFDYNNNNNQQQNVEQEQQQQDEEEKMEQPLLHSIHNMHNIHDTRNENQAIDTTKIKNFNILGNIDEHMFATNDSSANDIGIESSSDDDDDDDNDNDNINNDNNNNNNIKFIQDYARTKSIPESFGSPNREYVDLEKERELTTPFQNKPLKDIMDKTPPIIDINNDQCGGWYHDNDNDNDNDNDGDNDKKNKNKNNKIITDEHVDVNYLDKKLQEKFHGLSDPNLPNQYPRPQTQIKIKDLSLHWKIFDGLDFNQEATETTIITTDSSTDEHEFFKHEYSEEKSIKKEKENKDIYNSSSLNMNYRSNRKIDKVMQVCLNHIQLSFYQFEQHEYIANRLVVSIQNIQVLDLIRDSNFHKFLCFYRKQSSQHDHLYQNMIKLQMNSMRPEPKKDPDRLETDIIISVLPLRLNVDQLAIDFLIKFFSSFAQNSDENSKHNEKDKEDDQQQQEEEKEVLQDEEEEEEEEDEEEVEEEEEEKKEIICIDNKSSSADTYFQKFSFSELVICVDYNPRRVDFDKLRSGDYSQFVHLFPLCLVEISLQSFEIYGCSGWDGCFVELAKYWAIDFAKHQTHKYVAGIQPVRSLVNMGSGIADLVIIPVQQYKHDGRITKGIQKGATSAVTKITLETLDLSDGLFTTVHSFLTSLESLFHSKSTRRRKKRKRKSHKNKYNKKYFNNNKYKSRGHYLGISQNDHEPHNTTEGLRQASESFTKGIIEAAHSIAFVPMEKYKSSGVQAGFKSVLKGVPSAILHPLIGTTKAVSNAIVGVRNSIDGGGDDGTGDNLHDTFDNDNHTTDI